MNFFRFFTKSFAACRSEKGSALVVATIAIIASTLTVVGLATLIGKSATEGARSKEATGAYLAAEGVEETALFDIASHLPGYEVKPDASNYSWSRFGENESGVANWTLENRAEMTNEGYMKYPKSGLGTSGDREWNTLRPGGDDEVALFVDNTSRSGCVGETCPVN